MSKLCVSIIVLAALAAGGLASGGLPAVQAQPVCVNPAPPNPYQLAQEVCLDLNPPTATNDVGTNHTVTATLTFDNLPPTSPITVQIAVVSGPNIGMSANGQLDAAGQFAFTYTGAGTGTDKIHFCLLYASGGTGGCFVAFGPAVATKTWVPQAQPTPEERLAAEPTGGSDSGFAWWALVIAGAAGVAGGLVVGLAVWRKAS